MFDTVRLTQDYFSGGAGNLDRVVRGLAINAARQAAATITDLTDLSGGAAADGVVGDIPVPTAGFTEVGTASAPKAGFETALGTVKDAITELAAQLVTAKALIPVTDIANSVGGAAADGSIAAMTQTVTAVASAIAAFATGKVVLQNIKDYYYTLAVETNKLANACGVTPLTINIAGASFLGSGLAALSVDTGTSVAGASASGISKVQADAFLAACADATKEIATKLNAITGGTASKAVAVVAVTA